MITLINIVDNFISYLIETGQLISFMIGFSFMITIKALYSYGISKEKHKEQI